MPTPERPSYPVADSLPMFHGGDSFILELGPPAEPGDYCGSIRLAHNVQRSIHLVRILRYQDNHNSTPLNENLFDLSRQTIAAIKQRVNQKYPGYRVLFDETPFTKK